MQTTLPLLWYPLTIWRQRRACQLRDWRMSVSIIKLGRCALKHKNHMRVTSRLQLYIFNFYGNFDPKSNKSRDLLKSERKRLQCEHINFGNASHVWYQVLCIYLLNHVTIIGMDQAPAFHFHLMVNATFNKSIYLYVYTAAKYKGQPRRNWSLRFRSASAPATMSNWKTFNLEFR